MTVTHSDGGRRVDLHSPTAMPRASAFLWNRHMLLQVTCRGYAVAQYLDPEPVRYAYAPNLEAKTFMQPEQPTYAHHPGRFVYVKDEASGELFSAPYEPVRRVPDDFRFSVGLTDIAWTVTSLGIEVRMRVSLPRDDVAELWDIAIANRSGRTRAVSLYPYVPIGYMSWMNQSAEYRDDLGGVVATCVTPYQRVEDYEAIRRLRDRTVFLHDRAPDAFEACRETFEGEGGLHAPDAVMAEVLGNGEARYETPVAALQYRLHLTDGGAERFRFLLAPARDDEEIKRLRHRYLGDGGSRKAPTQPAAGIGQDSAAIAITTPDPHFDRFVNHWLPRQVRFHGELNRLCTDPQTRNYLQDAMGMSYLRPEAARSAFLHALGQQAESGAMPDGILLRADAELKYINRIPHTDHCVWLPVCLQAYLDESGDMAILDVPVPAFRGDGVATVFERATRAMRWLIAGRDERGLSHIAQGDWCDPMNMVGHKGRGVSGWLSLATARALRLWAAICAQRGRDDLAGEFETVAAEIDAAVNAHLWDGDWYGRGITDDGRVFGIRDDAEGRIFLNPQSWAILAGTAGADQRKRIIAAVDTHLDTPCGVQMLAPPFTGMHADIGRVTQKHPGSAENGSVYNHAAAFWAAALFAEGDGERAFRTIRRMIPGPDDGDYRRRQQLPVYIPNYYRGAWREFPRTAGRSSQLPNTGTVAWVYRLVIEGLFGLKGEGDGLRIDPCFPPDWREARATRHFRGATVELTVSRSAAVTGRRIVVDGEALPGNRIGPVEAGHTYRVSVQLPMESTDSGDGE